MFYNKEKEQKKFNKTNINKPSIEKEFIKDNENEKLKTQIIPSQNFLGVNTFIQNEKGVKREIEKNKSKGNIEIIDFEESFNNKEKIDSSDSNMDVTLIDSKSSSLIDLEKMNLKRNFYKLNKHIL